MAARENAGINREWRKGVIGGELAVSLSVWRNERISPRETIRSRKGARILRNACEWLCKTFGEAGSTGLNCDRARRLRN